MITIGVKYLWLVGLLAQAAGVQAPAEDKVKAKALLQEGLALNRQGQYAQALERFEAAYAAYPSPKLWFNIGQVQVALDHPVEATQAFEKFLALVPDAQPDDRQHARAAVAQMAKKLGRLQIKCENAGAEVAFDGKGVGRLPLADPLWATAGKHEVIISKDGFVRATETVELNAGATALVVIHLVPTSPQPSAPATPSSSAPTEATSQAPSGQPPSGPATVLTPESPGPEIQAPVAAPVTAVQEAEIPARTPDVTVQAPPAATPASLDLSTQPTPTEEPGQTRPFYKTWWLWTGAAVVVAGVVTTAILLTREAGTNVPTTDLGNHGVFQ